MYHSVVIRVDDRFINTYDDWHLIPSSRPVIAPPIERTKFVTVGGRSGSLDYSQSLTHKPVFDNLTGKIEFYVENDWWDNWETAYTTILDALQGKRVELALEDNPAHCYKGLLWVNTWKSQKGNSTITLEYNLQPDRIDRPVKQLVLNRTSVTLEKGMSFSLLVGIVPADTFYRKLQVTTSPRGIVSIGDDGRITALKNGACTIRAELGGTVAECAVRVQNYGLCKVENELANCRNENLDEAVLEESSYTARIVPDNEYDISTVTVMMGGVDITESAVAIADDKLSASIHVETVTGKIKITASAVQGEWYDVIYSLSNVTLDSAPKRARANDILTVTGTATSGMSIYNAVVTNRTEYVSAAGTSYRSLSEVKVEVTVKGTISIKMDAKVDPTLNDFSWKAIDFISSNKLAASMFKAGDSKTIHVEGNCYDGAHYSTNLNATILGIEHNTGYESGAGIHFILKCPNGKLATLSGGPMNNSTDGGWDMSYMRGTIIGNNGTPTDPLSKSQLGTLPADLRAVMKLCVKYTRNTFGIDKTTDYMWLLSEYEMHGSTRYSYSDEASYQRQYAYFANGGSKYCANPNSPANNCTQWMRSKASSNDGYFCRTNEDTGRGSYNGRNTLAFAVCFGV
jgi:hypothetical protein